MRQTSWLYTKCSQKVEIGANGITSPEPQPLDHITPNNIKENVPIRYKIKNKIQFTHSYIANRCQISLFKEEIISYHFTNLPEKQRMLENFKEEMKVKLFRFADVSNKV